MKPIAGSVVSSKPVSLSKAASILSRFVASDTGAHQDVSAFLRRTAEAFDEFARFHRDLGTQREEFGSKGGEKAERRKKERREKEEAVVGAALDGNLAEIEGKRRKKKKKNMREEAAVEAGQDGYSAEIGGNPGTSTGRHGGDALDLGESSSGGREKKSAAKEMEGSVGNVVEMESEKSNKIEVKMATNEDVKEGREGEGDVENHNERRRKKKRKKGEDVKEGSGDGVENHAKRHHKKKRKVREES